MKSRWSGSRSSSRTSTRFFPSPKHAAQSRIALPLTTDVIAHAHWVHRQGVRLTASRRSLCRSCNATQSSSPTSLRSSIRCTTTYITLTSPLPPATLSSLLLSLHALPEHLTLFNLKHFLHHHMKLSPEPPPVACRSRSLFRPWR